MKYILLFVIFLIAKPSSSVTVMQKVLIYSGNCTLYQKSFLPPNQVKYHVISKAFGKLVIDRANRHLNFYYDGLLVFTRNDFDSYNDMEVGGEGFTSYNGVDAHSYPAEHQFKINVRDVFVAKDQGYEYEISNYKVN